jgi:hypothetical protein
MPALDQVANFVKVTVAQGYGTTDTSIQLATGQGAKLLNPASGAYNLVWWNSTDYVDPADDPNVEIVRVTALSGDTLTVTRAQEGTTATQKQNATKIYKMMLGLTAKMVNDISALTGNGTPVENEIVSGSGTSWTLANTPIAGSVKLYAGTRLQGSGALADYSIVGTAITTVNSYPPGSLTADYRKNV